MVSLSTAVTKPVRDTGKRSRSKEKGYASQCQNAMINLKERPDVIEMLTKVSKILFRLIKHRKRMDLEEIGSAFCDGSKFNKLVGVFGSPEKLKSAFIKHSMFPYNLLLVNQGNRYWITFTN